MGELHDDDDWLTLGNADGNTKNLPVALGQRQPPGCSGDEGISCTRELQRIGARRIMVDRRKLSSGDILDSNGDISRQPP